MATGFPIWKKNKIFTPFYQIPSGNKPGTGIGLSLVKNLIEAHHGTVAVTDSPIKGATFTITIPLKTYEVLNFEEVPQQNQSTQTQEPAVISSENTEQQTATKTNKPLLLIVEDNVDMRDFLCNNFTADYRVISANDGIEGLEQINKKEVSLIISDLMMPRMDGLEFCQAVRSNILFSHIPFVLLTAKTDLDTKIDGLNFGADSYIEKPFFDKPPESANK